MTDVATVLLTISC